MRGPTIGTHNTHHERGRVTLFADAVGYTEADADNVRERVAAALSRASARLAGYGVRVCRGKKSLVFVARRNTWKITRTRWVPVHEGVPGVTPDRGTFVIETRRRVGRLRRATGRREVFLVCHRINSAFPPFRDGEGKFRAARWADHLATDNHLVRQYKGQGWAVHAMGDPNTPRGVIAFPALPWEIGIGLDRIASTEDLGEVTYLGHADSDHPRLRARLPR